MASPAEIANDMSAHAKYWHGRDEGVARCCRDAAKVIRALLAGEKVDGRTYGGVHRRLLNMSIGSARAQHLVGYPDFVRARITLERLSFVAIHGGDPRRG